MNFSRNIEYLVSIDLHGTLLDKDENLSIGSADKLLSLLQLKPKNIKIYICTGNDLAFVKRKLGEEIFDHFDGVVLETGVVISLDKEVETILVDDAIIAKIKKLQNELFSENYSEIYKFADRVASISMFTNHNEPVIDFYNKISEKLNYIKDEFRVTYSSVAVDIIPIGFNKFTGIKEIEKKLGNQDNITKIIAIADSVNDFELLRNADISFLPSNGNKSVILGLEKDGMNYLDFNSTDNFLSCDNSFFVSNNTTTAGVVEILEKII